MLQAAERELEEETGYSGGSYELADTLFEYPTKDLHTITVVRAKNVSLQSATKHEETEAIGNCTLLSIDDLSSQIARGEWKITSALAALLIALPELHR